MEFRILGPVEVHGEHGALALGGAKPRAILAFLALHANEWVSADRLAVALWGEEAPLSAVKRIQVHVSRLRKALGGSEILGATPAGYRLRVLPGELDAERFARLLENGQRALANGQAEDAAALLRQALALSRGPPLADLAFEPFAPAEIARLDELRLVAIETRVAADLLCNRHAAVVGELRQLVDTNPARETLVEQLMLALYRCGRQRAALALYARTDAYLREELGSEPGGRLKHLQRAILEEDPSLDAPMQSSGVGAPTRSAGREPDSLAQPTAPPPGNNAHDKPQLPPPGPAVFLCHSSNDKEYVRRLERRLRKSGMKTWLDERDLLPGREWDPAIRDAIRAADVVVVCLSSGSVNKSGYLQREIRHVLDVADEQPEGAIFVIPAKIEPCDVPGRLTRWHWVDLSKRRLQPTAGGDTGCCSYRVEAISGHG